MNMRYPELPSKLQELEDLTLEVWRQEGLFDRTMAATEDGEPFVFYEGPPTANGRPGLHHIISRAIKDLVCRFRTMQGRSVTRIAGWDTHGLPVEIEAEKKLGISGKPEIEALGIARFNEVCRESVFTYKEEWERLSERIGYWLDYSRPYVTFHTEYIESVWWILKQLAERGILYRGYKSVPYCPRCGTALSSHEVAQGYRDVEDPSLYFLAPLLEEDGTRDAQGRAFLVWTTTPWTVPSNVGLAVHPQLEYVEARWRDRVVILARARVEAVLGKGAEVLRTVPASEIVGRSYARPLDLVPAPSDPGNSWTVVAEDFVSADDGTGIVHMAPAFGSDDYTAGQRHGLAMLNPLDDRGRFEEAIPLVGGMFVKDADAVLVEELERVGNLFHVGSEEHSYPHCWRCDSPLIYMARDSWFAATSTLKDRMLENNGQVNWAPPEVGEGRFGEWLANNVDWALSRDRFWGTPLPAWVCDGDPDHLDWVGSLQELAERAGGLPEGFDPHRPFIDDVTWECTHCGGTMRRTPGVVDVWFDSGSMPYAQWHYPFENEDEWKAHFPADFICEGLDQTRGWFYSLMAISTMLDLGTPYRNVVVNGLILDADGQKMSKSKGNTVNPWDAIQDHGADAIRWYLITNSNPWVAKRWDPQALRETGRRLFDNLLNTYRFFQLYGNVEDWAPGEGATPVEQRPIMDRWILSRLNHLVRDVNQELETYQLTRAYRDVAEFVDEDLSNWYVRRCRQRFWGNSDDADGRAAFATLHEVLVVLSRLLAPVTPFMADWVHRALTGESVHLARFPTADEGLVDETLEAEMSTARSLATLGRAAREDVRIRVRQPLRRMYATLRQLPLPRPEIQDQVLAELNVKELRFPDSVDELMTLAPRPNYRALGPIFQKRTEMAAQAIRALSQDDLRSILEGGNAMVYVEGEDHSVDASVVEVVKEAQGSLILKAEEALTVALDPELDEELRSEGLARELINRIQRMRRDVGLEITDRIRLAVYGPDEVLSAASTHGPFISGETLAVELAVGEGSPAGLDHSRNVDIDGMKVSLALSVAKGA
jgi:isoleucyl-tRNA synthetase